MRLKFGQFFDVKKWQNIDVNKTSTLWRKTNGSRTDKIDITLHRIDVKIWLKFGQTFDVKVWPNIDVNKASTWWRKSDGNETDELMK